MLTIMMHIVKNTILQAIISATISCAVGILIARTIHLYHLTRITLGVRILGQLMFITPSISICIIALNTLDNIQGIQGIIVCNVAINLFYCCTVILDTYQTQFTQHTRSSIALLKLDNLQKIMLLELPIIKSAIAYSFIITLIMCINNFGICMIMGNGPQTTTLPVMIYQYSTLDQDNLVLITCIVLQVSLSMACFISMHKMHDVKLGQNYIWQNNQQLHPVWLLSAVVISTYYFAPFIQNNYCVNTLTNSITIATITGLLCMSLSLFILTYLFITQKIYNLRYHYIMNGLCSIPNLVIITSVYAISLRLLNDRYSCVIALIIVNVLLYIPFTLFFLVNSIKKLSRNYYQSTLLLRLNYWQVLFTIILPLCKRNITLVAGIICCFAMGDISAQLFFLMDHVETLAIQGYKTAIVYNLQDARQYNNTLLTIVYLFIIAINTRWKIEKINYKKFRTLLRTE